MREPINKYFYRDEFECKCGCGFDTVDVKLNYILEDLREWFKVPVTVNSACRCKDYNEFVGSKDTSQHRLGKAADVVVSGISPLVVYYYLDSKYQDNHGVGLYDSFTHVDSRRRKARWNNSKTEIKG